MKIESFVNWMATADRLYLPREASEGKGRAMVFLRPGGVFRVGRK